MRNETKARRALGTSLACAALMSAAISVGVPSASAVPACTPWTVGTVASGFGPLENLTFDDHGSMFLSETSFVGPGSIRTLTADGRRGTAVTDVTSPGGLVASEGTLYFATGNGPVSGFLGIADGTVDALDTTTGTRTTYASGVVMPNGMAGTAEGDLLVTRNAGVPSGLTRISAENPGAPEVVRTDLGTANGIAVAGDKVYVANTFDPELMVTELDSKDLRGRATRIPVDGFGPFTASDDMTIGPDGLLYVAQNLAGRVLRIDPATGASCVIGTSMPLTTSVEFGGVGWDRNSLFATSFDGTIRKLTPA